MIGHVLRSEDNSPAVLALDFAIRSDETMNGRLGRHQTNLLSVIRKDLKSRNISLKTLSDFQNIREVARDRKLWRKMCLV